MEVELAGDDPALLKRLITVYRRVRDGLGFRKDPAEFGAFPTDCYSHTPAHAGAQQPGMTGQVKEEVLTRGGELGLRFMDGRLAWGSPLLPAEELWLDDGATSAFQVTVCGTPVRIERADTDEIEVHATDGAVQVIPGRVTDDGTAAAVLDRTGAVTGITFRLAVAG